MLVQNLLEALLRILEDETRTLVNSWFLAPSKDFMDS